jgi:hypothetical protein
MNNSAQSVLLFVLGVGLAFALWWFIERMPCKTSGGGCGCGG